MKSNLHLLITVIMLLCFPKASFGQAPDLGRASGFTIFTAAGAITNNGASIVTGDVGNYVGAFDFTDGTINGSRFLAGSSEAFDAAADLALAYGNISTLSGTVLGVTMVTTTLTPGIYETGAATTLNGTLTLDGQGDPNALFIIKIGGAFATGSGAVVKLINSASLCNVFWQIDGQFDLGDHSSFVGNVLASGAINLLEGSSLMGRALSTAGAVALHSNEVIFEPKAAGTVTGASPVCQGETLVTYSVLPIDNASSYTWTLPPGASITAGDGTNSITVSYSNTASSGNVSVQGTSSCGTGAVSPVLPVTVNPVPKPTDQTTDITTGDSFSVTPSGVPAGTTYTWPAPLYTGGVTGGSAQPIPQTTISQLLTIPSGTGTATYTVTPSSGSCNGNPFEVTVTVSASCVPVTIVTQPSDLTLCTGTGNPSFTLTAAGSGPYTYQWQYENAGAWSNVSDGIPASAVYTNTNTATLDISGITAAGTYNYKNILTNCLGTNTVTSNTVTLTINPNTGTPVFTAGSTVICQDSPDETYLATATNSTSISYSVTPVASGIIDASTGVMNWDAAFSGPATVTATATGLCSTTSTDLSVTVNPVPKITDKIRTITTGESFSVIPTGVPAGTTYTWPAPLYTGGVTGGSAQAVPQTSISQLLTIPSGTGTATYIVTPMSGSCNGNPFNVTVNVSTSCVPVSIDTQPSDLTLCTGSGNPSFTLEAGGSGPYTYQWQYENAGVWSNVSDGIPTNALYATANTETLGISGITAAGTYSYKNILTNCLGTNTVTSNTVILTINPNTGIPVFTAGLTVLCQDSPDETYLATATNSTSMAYSVTPVSAGIIDASTGVMNWDAAFSGPATVTATATGLCTTTVTDLVVTVNPSTGKPVFTAGRIVLCQDSPDRTYHATATNSTSMVYSVTPASAGIIDASTGVMNWDAAFSGLATVTATAMGLCTTTFTDLSVTVNPSTGNPVFTAGNANLCQDSPDETYLATATNSTSMVYSVTPVSAGVINASTGVMNWEAAFSGPATIRATAIGLCTSPYTDLLVTINPLPLAAGVITGPESVCQTATGNVYSVALITNATGYNWSLPAGATIASGANTNSITVDFDANAVSGNITVQGSNGCGVGTLSPPLAILVKITLVALAGSNSPVCEGSSIMLTAQTQVGGTYIWTGPNGFASNVQNPVIPNATALQAGDYTLIVTTSCYCCYSAPSTVTVVVNNCYVADLGITMTVDNIHPFMGRNVEFAVTATNQGPDKATGVSISDLLPDGYTYVSSTTSVSSYDSNTGVWNIGTLNQGESELLTIIATANSTGNYINTASVTGLEVDGDLTNNVASVTTIPTDFFIPEGFSPNGDGINDLFVIRGILNYPANKIVIYNRWGSKVFEASPYLNNWDGQANKGLRINGSNLPTGTYFYLLDLGDGTDMIKGTIYLNQ